MFKIKKIKYKIILLFSLLALLLITTGTLYFYLSGNQYIKDQVNKEMALYSELYKTKATELLSNYLLEINGLNTHLNTIEENTADINKQKRILDALKNFSLLNKDRYEKLIYKKKNDKTAIEVEHVKVFSGEYKTRTVELDHFQYNNILSDFNKSKDGFIKSNLNLQSKDILLSNSNSNNKNITIGKLLFNNFFLHIESSIPIPANVSFFVVDSSNYIIYSKQSVFNKKKIESIIDKKVKSYHNSKIIHSNTNTSFLFDYLDDLNITIVVANDYSDTTTGFSSFIENGLMISILLFFIILVLVYMVANKISGTVSTIASIADNVAKGDFSQKIEITREDELGFLINSFNNMVGNLDKSYRELNILNKELQDKIDEIIRTKEELSKSQKLALIGETVSKISHEIQNKISGISIWIQNLEMKLKDDDIAQVYLDEMRSALKNFMNMLVNFKKFYRKPVINPTLINLNNVLHSTINKLEEEFNQNSIMYKIITEQEKLEIEADKELLEECLINLLINAIHYSPSGSSIIVKMYSNNHFVSISISDEGEGISSEDLPHLFEPFFTTNQSGSGLGLSIVKNIVDAHSGKITFHNIKPTGACFIIELPTKRDE